MLRAMKIINYTVECSLSLSNDATLSSSKTAVRKLPNPDIVDEDFVLRHKTKVKKLYQHMMLINNCLPLSVVTRDHIYPQYGGVIGKDVAISFLKGLQNVGLGEYHGDGESIARPYFKIIDINDTENIPAHIHSLLVKLQIHKIHSTA